MTETSSGTVVAVGFPWGRYHANPWRRNVNEAALDWPPAPWRILRALYSTWQWRCPHLAAELVEPLLGRLVAPPRYHLPPFSVGHTRHYLPGIKHRPGVSTDTDKALDTFVAFERGAEVLVRWPVDLDEEQRAALDELCRALPYLGRAESITEARLLPAGAPLPAEGWLDEGLVPSADSPSEAFVPVLGPAEPLDLGALVRSPHEVRSARLLVPPSSRWLRYPEPEPARPARRQPRAPSTERATAVRLALSGAALAPVTAAVAVGDVLHKAACSRLTTPTLSGRGADGAPLRGVHGHAHYLAFPAAGDVRSLDAVVVWAPDGLSEDEVRLAFGRPLDLWAPEHVKGVNGRRATLEAVGDVATVAPELVAPPPGARRWRSVTPYAPVRHAKKRQTLDDLLLDDVRHELGHRGLPTQVAVVPYDRPRERWTSYRRYRAFESLRDARRAYGLELVFDEPVRGPLALGQLSHFGLGLFRPVPGS